MRVIIAIYLKKQQAHQLELFEADKKKSNKAIDAKIRANGTIFSNDCERKVITVIRSNE